MGLETTCRKVCREETANPNISIDQANIFLCVLVSHKPCPHRKQI